MTEAPLQNNDGHVCACPSCRRDLFPTCLEAMEASWSVHMPAPSIYEFWPSEVYCDGVSIPDVVAYRESFHAVDELPDGTTVRTDRQGWVLSLTLLPAEDGDRPRAHACAVCENAPCHTLRRGEVTAVTGPEKWRLEHAIPTLKLLKAMRSESSKVRGG